MKKKLVVAVTAGALTLAAGQAFALENIFNGMLKIKGDFSNFDGLGGNPVAAPQTAAQAANVNPPPKGGTTHAYVEQRARLFYTAKANDDLKLVTGFEIDSRWGDASQGGTTRNNGGAIETDAVNLETKQVYLDFMIPKTPINAKVGLLPYNDAYKGVFLNADVAAALLSAKLDKSTIGVGWLRAYDNVGSAGFGATGTGGYAVGKQSLDVTTFDYKLALNKDLTIGASDYVVYERMRNTVGDGGKNLLNTFGLNASANVGPATIDGFFLWQYGDMPSNGGAFDARTNKVGKHVSAFAANLAAKVKAGPGTVRGNLLYTSGDKGNRNGSTHAFQGVNQYGGQTANFASAQMTMLMLTTKHAMNTDRALIGSSSNNQQGVVGAFFGYDLAIDKMFGSANLGFAMTDKNNGNAPRNSRGEVNGTQYMGTEVNLEVGYKLYDNLSASVVGGFLYLGDYYKGTSTDRWGNASSPDDPWKTQLVLSYAF